MNFCPECGNKLTKDSKFCSNCGFQLDKSEKDNTTPQNDPTTIICKNCGEENSTDEIYCRNCGLLLKSKDSVKKDKSEVRPKKNKHMKKSETKKTVAGLKPYVVYMIFGGILLIVAVMFFSSDVLSKPPKASGNSVANHSSGVSLSNIGKINELKTKLERNPKDAETILELANLENDSGMYQQAVSDYEKYLKYDPKNADVLVDLGTCYYNLSDFQKAMASMKEALKYNPRHQIAHLNLGIVNLALGNLKASMKWLQEAVKIDSSSEAGKRAEEILKSHNQAGGN